MNTQTKDMIIVLTAIVIIAGLMFATAVVVEKERTKQAIIQSTACRRY